MGRLKKCALAVMLVLMVCVLSSCGKKEKADFSSINKIAQLSAYECYYHNVASLEEPGNQFVIKYGNKKVWIEYTGVVTIGIDVSKVKLKEKDNNVVEITIPPVQVQGTKIEKNGIGQVLIETGTFASITKEEEFAAISEAQKCMEESASKDTGLLAQGKERVKYLLENFVKTIGNQLGRDYTIEWIELD